jgi:hypothetical protein
MFLAAAVAFVVVQRRLSLTCAVQVIVDYTVAPDAAGKPIAPAAITAAFKAPGVSIGGSRTTAAVVAADVAPAKATAMPACE